MDLNQVVLHLWSKSGDSSLNGWVTSYHKDKLVIDAHTDIHMHRHRYAGNSNTWRRKLALGKNTCKYMKKISKAAKKLTNFIFTTTHKKNTINIQWSYPGEWISNIDNWYNFTEWFDGKNSPISANSPFSFNIWKFLNHMRLSAMLNVNTWSKKGWLFGWWLGVEKV